MKITKSQFISWKHDIITQEFYKALQELRIEIEEQLLNADNIFKIDSDKVLARLVGQREGIDTVLNLSIEDYEDDDEESEASGVSGISEIEKN